MFYNEIQSFHENLDTIREFIYSLEPVLLQKIDENFKNDVDDLRVLQLILSESNPDNDDNNFKLSEEAKRKIRDNFDGEIIIKQNEDGNGFHLKVNGNGGKRFNKAMLNLRKFNEEKMLLYKSSLMNIISTVECFLSDILQKYLKKYKQEITSVLILKKDKQFTMDELESFESIEDAKTYIIDSKIENLIRGGFEDWVDFLKEKMHMHMGYLNDEKEKIIEIFQRRNIVVHNKGIVNSIYLSKVADKHQNEIKMGERIFLDRDYLENAINTLELNFSLIAFELWKNKIQHDNSRYELLANLISENMDSKRWSLVKGYTIFLYNDSGCTQWYKMFSKINNWLAYKRLGCFEKVKNKVIEEDFSACSIEFQICQQALLGDSNKVFDLMREALKNNIINFQDIESWPVFDEYRDDELYKQMHNEWGQKEKPDIIDCKSELINSVVKDGELEKDI